MIGLAVSLPLLVYVVWAWECALRRESKARLAAKLAEIDRDHAEAKVRMAEDRARHAEAMREYAQQHATLLQALLDPSSVTIEVHSIEDEKPN